MVHMSIVSTLGQHMAVPANGHLYSSQREYCSSKRLSQPMEASTRHKVNIVVANECPSQWRPVLITKSTLQ